MQLILSFPEYAAVSGISGIHPAIIKLLASAQLATSGKARRWTVEGERADFLAVQQDLLAAAKHVSRPRVATAIRTVIKAIDDLLGESHKVLHLRPDSLPSDKE